jgi:hypothetical protein
MRLAALQTAFDGEDGVYEALLAAVDPRRPPSTNGISPHLHGPVRRPARGRSRAAAGAPAPLPGHWHQALVREDWFNGHLRTQGLGGYYGLWAFEAAAVAQRTGWTAARWRTGSCRRHPESTAADGLTRHHAGRELGGRIALVGRHIRLPALRDFAWPDQQDDAMAGDLDGGAIFPCCSSCSSAPAQAAAWPIYGAGEGCPCVLAAPMPLKQASWQVSIHADGPDARRRRHRHRAAPSAPC